MSTPKQELFTAQYIEFLDTTLMIGIGAASNFHTRRIEFGLMWTKAAGLERLQRLLPTPW